MIAANKTDLIFTEQLLKNGFLIAKVQLRLNAERVRLHRLRIIFLPTVLTFIQLKILTESNVLFAVTSEKKGNKNVI